MDFEGWHAKDILLRLALICRSCDCGCRLTERLHGHSLVIHDVEDSIKFCNLHKVPDLAREVEKLEFSLLLPYGRKRTDQSTQAHAVDVMDITEIEQNLLMSVLEQVTNQIAQCCALLAKFKPTADVYNLNAVNLSNTHRHFHWQPPVALKNRTPLLAKRKQPTVTRLFNIAHTKTALKGELAQLLQFLVPNNVYLPHADLAQGAAKVRNPPCQHL